MKYNKIITITLANGLALLVFASMLAGCQKNGIKTSGHFTSFSMGGRFPASLDPIDDHFDPKQIYIYCNLNSINNKQCFKQHFNEKLQQLTTTNKISREKALEFNVDEYFEKSQIQVAKIANSIVTLMNNQIYSYTKRKEKLCDDNEVIYLKQCLFNSIDADSVHILNTYQQTNPDINGQEYLFLKNQIRVSLTNNLNDMLAKLQSKHKRNVIKIFDNKYSILKRKLDKNRDWISNVTTLPSAIASCVDEVENELKNQKELYRSGINVKEFIKEYFCMDYVNSPEIMEVVNYKFNQNFEKKLSILFEIIKVSAPEVVQNCVGSRQRSSDVMNSCLEKNWEKIVGLSYDRWIKEGQNENFSKEKDLIIQRTKNIAPKLKREIASSFE